MSNTDSIQNNDELRKMLHYIANRDRLENIERDLNNFINESFKRQEEVILAFIETTNEIQEFADLVGKDFRRIRHLIHKTDLHSAEITQQFRHMLKYIYSKLIQNKGMKVSIISNYHNRLLDLKQSLNETKNKIHSKNRKSAMLIRKMQLQINILIERISAVNSVEQNMPARSSNANHIAST